MKTSYCSGGKNITKIIVLAFFLGIVLTSISGFIIGNSTYIHCPPSNNFQRYYGTPYPYYYEQGCQYPQTDFGVGYSLYEGLQAKGLVIDLTLFSVVSLPIAAIFISQKGKKK